MNGVTPANKLVPFPAPPPVDEPPRASSRAYWLAGVLMALALVVAAVAGARWLASAGGSIRYTTLPVTRGDITRTVIATGTLNPELTIIVGTYVSGVIKDLFCDYNSKVHKGQVCAKIDPRPYQTVVDQSKANLAVAMAQLEKDRAALAYAKTTFERITRLFQSNAASLDALDNSRSAYAQAQAQITFDEAMIQQRQAALEAAQVNLDYTDIVSPVDGIVVSRNVTMGQTVAASFQTPTLFLIATDLTKMEVDANVSESDIGGIQVGNTGTFTVDAFPKRTFHGTVSQVRQSPQTVQNVVTYDVVVSVDNADLALKPGMTAATRIIVDQRGAVIRVPNAALRYEPGGHIGRGGPVESRIWVLREGRPVAVPVSLGLEDDSFTEVTGGELQPGDEVITAEQSVTSSTVMPRLRF